MKVKFVLLLISLLFNTTTSTFYKLITINNKTMCLESLTKNYLTTKFNAVEGLCKKHTCSNYIKTKNIPFCCSIDIYSCL